MCRSGSSKVETIQVSRYDYAVTCPHSQAGVLGMGLTEGSEEGLVKHYKLSDHDQIRR